MSVGVAVGVYVYIDKTVFKQWLGNNQLCECESFIFYFFTLFESLDTGIIL